MTGIVIGVLVLGIVIGVLGHTYFEKEELTAKEELKDWAGRLDAAVVALASTGGAEVRVAEARTKAVISEIRKKLF